MEVYKEKLEVLDRQAEELVQAVRANVPSPLLKPCEFPF